MTAPQDGSEMALCRAYREAALHYEEALRLADQLPAAFGQEGADATLQRIVALLAEIKEIDSSAAAERQSWQATRRQPSAELAGELARVTSLIQRLAARVDQAERAATVQRERLAPELEDIARARRMQRAYGDTGTTR